MQEQLQETTSVFGCKWIPAGDISGNVLASKWVEAAGDLHLGQNRWSMQRRVGVVFFFRHNPTGNITCLLPALVPTQKQQTDNLLMGDIWVALHQCTEGQSQHVLVTVQHFSLRKEAVR